MKTLVVKFGGAAVATAQHFGLIAQIIARRRIQYDRVVAVVSAMGDTTDELVALAHQVNQTPPKRELDMLISAGERMSCALLAMALDKIGLAAISFTGSQSGIITCERPGEARVLEVRPERILTHLARGAVVVVAGFQGMSRQCREITTLGRGGSDTTAVALAIALGAERVEFFKDVPGIYNTDPKTNPEAQLIPHMSFEEAVAVMERSKHHVLHPRCLHLAGRNGLPLHVLCFHHALADPPTAGTVIGQGSNRCPQPLFEEL